jgi:hypothetical protein
MVSCGLSGPVWSCPIFQNYLIKGKIFGAELSFFEHEICCDFSLQLLPETFLTLRRTQRDIITNLRRSSCNVYCQIKKKNLELFSTDFQKTLECTRKTSRKSVSSEPSSFMRTDRQLIMTELIVAFCNLALRLKEAS